MTHVRGVVAHGDQSTTSMLSSVIITYISKLIYLLSLPRSTSFTSTSAGFLVPSTLCHLDVGSLVGNVSLHKIEQLLLHFGSSDLLGEVR